jgi:hypothetical protein
MLLFCFFLSKSWVMLRKRLATTPKKITLLIFLAFGLASGAKIGLGQLRSTYRCCFYFYNPLAIFFPAHNPLRGLARSL